MISGRTSLSVLAIIGSLLVAPLSTARPLTKAETPVCKSVQHCLEIVERHDFESFDYDVLREEFSRFGDTGKKQLFKAMAGKNTDLSKHATLLLYYLDFNFSTDEVNDIADQWPHGGVEALAALMLKQYTPTIRQAAISTLTNADENVRFWSREILKFGEMSSNVSHTQIQGFEPTLAAFETLKAAAFTDPTPDITNFIAQYPVEKSQPILSVLLSSKSSGVVNAALNGLYESDKKTSFKFLRESVSRLNNSDEKTALAIAGAVRAQYYETQDREFITFASRMLTDKSASDTEALVGADILMGLERGTKLPETDIAMKGLESALAAHGTVPSYYLGGLKQKFGSQLARGLNLFWASFAEPVSPNKSIFVSELSRFPANETVLKILQSALGDKNDWRVVAEASRVVSENELTTLKPSLEKIADKYPVLEARAAVLSALDSLSSKGPIRYIEASLEWQKKLIKNAKTCPVNAFDFKDQSVQLPYFETTQIAYFRKTTRSILSSAVSTGGGWLAGYDFGEFSGGLVYYDNLTGTGRMIYGQADPNESASEYYVPNIIGIVPKVRQPVGHYGEGYWAFSGIDHFGSEGAVLSVSVQPDGIQVKRHFQLPQAPQAIERLEDNSLLIGFGDKPEGNNMPEYLLSYYPPPLRLLPDGTVVPGCSDLPALKTQASP